MRDWLHTAYIYAYVSACNNILCARVFDVIRAASYRTEMPALVADADLVRALVAHFGKQTIVAERLSTTQATVSRWMAGSEPKGKHVAAIVALAEEVGLADDPELAVKTVPVVGHVSAGNALSAYIDGQGELERVTAPEGATKATVAVDIRGESLGAFFEHWLVFYDDVRRPFTEDLLERLCVVGLPDGRVLIKKVRKGREPGEYDLYSQTEGPIYGEEIEWAAPVKSMQPRA